MDNSHTDFDNFRRKPKGLLRGTIKRARRKVNNVAPRLKTIQDVYGSEQLAEIQQNDGSTINNPNGENAPQFTTVQNEDGSESVVQINEIDETTNDFKKSKMKKFNNAVKRVAKVKRKPVRKVRRKKTPKSVGDETLEFVYPLVKAMRIGLENKGLNTNRLTKQAIIEKFYNEFVSKKNDASSLDEPLKDGWLTDHYLFKADFNTFDSDNLGSLGDIQTVANVGKKVFGKIKGFIGRRKAAKKNKTNPKTVLPKSENQVAIEAESVMQQAKAEKELGQTVTKEEAKKSMVKYIVYAVIAVAIIIGLVKYLRK